MLELRPNCECCDKDLPPECNEAVICSFISAHFVPEIARKTYSSVFVPKLRGAIWSKRPIRPQTLLATNPPSKERILDQDSVVVNPHNVPAVRPCGPDAGTARSSDAAAAGVKRKNPATKR